MATVAGGAGPGERARPRGAPGGGAGAAAPRPGAAERGVPLYRHFAALLGQPLRALPRPTINLFSGGKHAGGQVAIQDVLLIPMARTVDDCLAMVFAVYEAAAQQ